MRAPFARMSSLISGTMSGVVSLVFSRPVTLMTMHPALRACGSTCAFVSRPEARKTRSRCLNAPGSGRSTVISPSPKGTTLPDRTVGGVDIQGANREAALLEDAEEFGSQYPRSADNPDAVCRHNGPLFHFAERHPPPAHRTGYHIGMGGKRRRQNGHESPLARSWNAIPCAMRNRLIVCTLHKTEWVGVIWGRGVMGDDFNEPTRDINWRRTGLKASILRCAPDRHRFRDHAGDHPARPLLDHRHSPVGPPRPETRGSRMHRICRILWSVRDYR